MRTKTRSKPTPVTSENAPRVLAEKLQVLESDPKNVDAWKASVKAMLAMGQLLEAQAAQLQVVQLRPDAAAWREYGRIQIMRGLPEEGVIRAFEKALELDPQAHDARVQLALYLIHYARLGDAGRHFAQVLAADPTHAGALAGAALVLSRQGDLDAAWKLVRPLLSRRRLDSTVALPVAQLCRRVGAHQEGLDLIRRTTRRQGIDEHSRAMLLHEEGSLFDAVGNPEAAWRSWTRANQLRRQRFDIAHHDAQIGAILSVTQHVPSPVGPVDDRPVFIVGAPRSGTTLLETMLDGLEGVIGIGESFAMQEVKDLALQGADPNLTYYRQLDAIAAVGPGPGEHYLAMLDQQAPGARRVIDKMPDNAFHLALISIFLPGARVIWIERDPDDNAVSCFQQTFGPGLAWSTSLAGIRCWQRNLKRIKAHWEEVLPLPILTVQYEDLVREPEAQLQRIAGFLDVPYDASAIDFHERRRQVKTASFDQVVQPLNTRSIGRGAAYRPFFGED